MSAFIIAAWLKSSETLSASNEWTSARVKGPLQLVVVCARFNNIIVQYFTVSFSCIWTIN